MEFKFRIYTRMLLMLVFMAPVSCAASDKFYADNVPPTGNPIEENTEYFEKFVDLGSATLEEKVDMAARLIPTPAQLEWQRWELTAFIHFTVNTWTGQEWGDGTENPDVFNPGELDTDQWVRTLKDAGFKLVMLTAKHHDGFCLWPTKTTSHSVASSSWKDGKGDVVQMLRESCDKYGMKLGLYVSPWDRNASCYGTPEYDDMFVAQITELLTWYGDVAEMWFDGANGSSIPGTPTHTFDWPRYMKAVKDLQPHVVTAIMGDDIRWVGNEAGRGREQEWSSVALQPAPLKIRLRLSRVSKRNRQIWAAVTCFPAPRRCIGIRPKSMFRSATDGSTTPISNPRALKRSSRSILHRWDRMRFCCSISRLIRGDFCLMPMCSVSVNSGPGSGNPSPTIG